jgi:uncharacterized protein DUF4157
MRDLVLVQKPAAATRARHATSPPVRRCAEGLQRALGNRATHQLLHAKLAVSQPGDRDEQEADRVADEVMRMPAGGSEPAPRLQCKCNACEDEERMLHRQENGPGLDAAPPIVGEVLRSPGKPLDAATRAFMEPRFGRGFGNVRVHTDAHAARSADAVQARAFAVGDHVVFAANQYTPDSESGRRLLAHELAHVAQQGAEDGMPQLQRWAIAKCLPSEEEEVVSAITRAYADLTAVLPRLKTRPVPDRVKDALWLAFRDGTDPTADLVADNVARLQSQITGTRFFCADATSDDGCKRGDYANATTGNPQGYTTVCRPQFFASDMSPQARSQTVIHEAAHMYLSMKDRGYFASKGNLCAETAHPAAPFDPQHKDSGTAGDNPAIRLENADSYGCLVHYLRYLQGDTLATTAASYRGASLAIKPLDDLDGTLYTRASIPPRHRFGITGVPDNSGFQYRWYLWAGSTAYEPKTTGRGNASVFADDNTEVYVSTELGRRLEQDHVTQAMLVCEVQLFGAFGDRFAPPVRAEHLDVKVVAGPPPFDL